MSWDKTCYWRDGNVEWHVNHETGEARVWVNNVLMSRTFDWMSCPKCGGFLPEGVRRISILADYFEGKKKQKEEEEKEKDGE